MEDQNQPRAQSMAWKWTLLIAWSVYATSSVDRVAGGDSGELLAEACVGGVAHPPGYPLLLLLLRILRRLQQMLWPHIRFVLLANHANALLAAIAAACATEVVDRLTKRVATVEAIAAGLMFAFSRLAWEYAIGLEVFALNNLLVGLLLLRFTRYMLLPRQVKLRELYVGAFLCGLGLTNQHTIVLFELPMIAWILATAPPAKTIDILVVSGSFFVGLSPYAYTVLAAQVPTPGSWGNTSTFHGLLTHILRREYGTFQLSPQSYPTAGFLPRVWLYMADIPEEFTISGTILTIVGVFSSLIDDSPSGQLPEPIHSPHKHAKYPVTTSTTQHHLRPHAPLRRRVSSLSLALLFILLVYVVVFNALANLPLDAELPREVTRRFFMQPNLVISVWIGWALAWLRIRVFGPCLLGNATYMHQNSAIGAKLALSIVPLALVVMQWHRHAARFTTSAWAQRDLIRELGEATLTVLPEHALLLSYTDIQWNAVRYLQTCEDQRRDVVHLNLQLLAFEWFPRQQALYSDSVVFPHVASDVTTNRSAPEYVRYLTRFLASNLLPETKTPPRTRQLASSIPTKRSLGLPAHGPYLDLHAVEESQLGEQQFFHGFQLLPTGVLWHVTRAASDEIAAQSWQTYAMEAPPMTSSWPPLLANDEEETASDYARLVACVPHGSWEFVALSIAHDARYQRSLARLGYMMTSGSTPRSMKELGKHILVYHAIQQELLWLATRSSGALSYPIYAVEKNAIVSLLRFQLLLDVYADRTSVASDSDSQSSKHLQSLVAHRSESREFTIQRLAAFVPQMKSHSDADADAIRSGMQSLEVRHKARTKNKLGNGELHSKPRARQRKTAKENASKKE